MTIIMLSHKIPQSLKIEQNKQKKENRTRNLTRRIPRVHWRTDRCTGPQFDEGTTGLGGDGTELSPSGPSYRRYSLFSTGYVEKSHVRAIINEILEHYCTSLCSHKRLTMISNLLSHAHTKVSLHRSSYLYS